MKSLVRKIALKLSDRFFGFKFKYYITYVKAKLDYSNSNSRKYDLVFVSPEKGWILDGICKEINRYYPGDTAFVYTIESLPPSKAYFFSHYSLLSPAILANPYILGSRKFVWYTHARSIGTLDSELVYVLNQSSTVFTTNSYNQKLLISSGLNPHKVAVALGGADETLFVSPMSIRKNRPCIGFCLGFRGHQGYRERKNYDLIVELIKVIQNADVIILGKNWSQYERFGELKKLPYFRYVEVPYAEYPAYYQQMDVFVSASKLEGGPIPLIEAMMCNVFPVVSNTGFAPDIITHGKNGLLFDVNASVATIYGLINKALTLQVNVRETVEHLTWKNFSEEIQKAIKSA
jgi:glycosyltransferase involved in cell wall biosynthesis